MKKILVTLLAVGMSAAMFAQNPPPPPPPECGPKGPCPMGMKGPHDFKKVKEGYDTLKAKYPKEMAEIEALRKESFEKMKEADIKCAELAKKENLDLPCVKKVEMMKKMEERKAKMDAFKAKYAKEVKEAEDAKKASREADAKLKKLMKDEGIECPPPFMGPKHGPKHGPKGPCPDGKPMPPPPPPAPAK